MIPISLTIKGLYSYQNEQFIQFKPLLEGQIFGIFGPVGSGKSSILEAICFALYDETERLLKRGDNRYYNMMNLKSDTILIDFIFQNYDGTEYRFTVKGKRRSSDFANVPTFTRTGYKKVKNEEEEWLPIDNTSAESILGLSYENFKRTIIIPQGRFQEFLQLGDKARTDMLKDIFHLNKFEFSNQTAFLFKKNEVKINILKGRLIHFQDLNKPLINEKRALAIAKEKELKTEHDLLSVKEKNQKEQQTIKARFEALEQINGAIQKLSEQKEGLEALKRQVNAYESCRVEFKSTLDLKNEAKHILALKNAKLTKEVDQFDLLYQHIENRQNKFAEVKEKYSNLDNLKMQISDFETLARIAKKQSEYIDLTKRVEQLAREVMQQEAAKTALSKKITIEKEALKKLKTSIPDSWDLADIDKWFDKRSSLLEQVNQGQQALEKKKADIEEFKLTWWLGMDPAIQNKLSALKAGPSAEHALKIKSLLATRAEERAKVAKDLENIRLHAKIEHFKHQLKPGDTCPLCGSEEHPEIVEDKDIEAKLDKAENAFKAVSAKYESLLAAGQLLEIALKDYQVVLAQLEEQNQFRETALGKFQKHLEGFKWEKFDPEKENEFRSFMRNVKVAVEKIKPFEESVEKSENQLEELLVKFQNLVQSKHETNNSLAAKESEVKTLKLQLKILKTDQFPQDKAKLEAMGSTLSKEVDQITSEFHSMQSELNLLQQQKANAKGSIDQMRKEFEEQEVRLNNIINSLNEAIKTSAFCDLDEIEDILATDLDIEKSKGRIVAFDQQWYKLEEDRKFIESELAGVIFDAEQFEKLVKEVQMLQLRCQELNDMLVNQKTEITRLEESLEQKIQLEKELNALQVREGDLKILRKMFKGSGFVNFISSVYLKNLCEAANERFSKLTRQQLRLEISVSNNFEVKDFLNDGRSRSVKTLSGGQTFQAALSLALALADSVQQQNKARQNFFFLDEGFGSLDKESLQTVFETLKQLRKENRIVGVISHVEDLQQEIDVYLKINNDPEKGSSILPSWKG